MKNVSNLLQEKLKVKKNVNYLIWLEKIFELRVAEEASNENESNYFKRKLKEM